jgi:hypothetical protein
MVHGWPFIFMFTSDRLGPGQEILVEYGSAYWENMRQYYTPKPKTKEAEKPRRGGAGAGGGAHDMDVDAFDDIVDGVALHV